ncbi:hypothetical protein CDN99_25650 [Roseateles aquatilis]|uniref:DUF2523 domain-containing protein n=1 Tax=Roseateles aquatilis TaxID=431061 RepID=A0A246IUH4_9BURK|nr:DUF2523 domain-containing protein [Roseateles aquatilis]OWQ83853.1 hypothetical protein CDN99_25650 [Roseateles aquatilis]
MPIFIVALIGALVQAAGTLVGRVLISLGIGYFAYKGIDTSIAWIRDQALVHIASLDANAVRAASSLRIGQCISIVSSALVVRWTLKGMVGGVVKRMGLK